MSAPVSVRRHNPPLWFHQWGSTAASWILPAPGVLSLPSISHTFAKLFAVEKCPAVLQTGETLNYYYNYKFQWPMVTPTYLFKFSLSDFLGLLGRRQIQTQFYVRFVVNCLTFPGVNISSCLQPKCSPEDNAHWKIWETTKKLQSSNGSGFWVRSIICFFQTYQLLCVPPFIIIFITLIFIFKGSAPV